MKKCNKCNAIKPLTEYHKDKHKKDGLCTACKTCKNLLALNYASKNRELLSRKSRAYREANLEACREREREYSAANSARRSEKVKEFHEKNPHKRTEYQRVYRKKPSNVEKIRANAREYDRKKRENCDIYKLTKICRSRIHIALSRKGFKKTGRTFQTIGCSPEDLKKHLEGMFSEGMSWENYGEWHIDHKTPLALGKTKEEILRLSHYSNLQPLWAKDNFSKGARIDYCDNTVTA